MFDQILELVKEHLGNNPEAKAAIPAGREEEVHNEVATQINDGLKNQASQQGGIGGLLSMLTGAIGSGSPATSAIEGGLAGSLAGKLGLPPAAVGAIAAALPGILAKFAHKANDPNDQSITAESIQNSLGGSGGIGGMLGGLFK